MRVALVHDWLVAQRGGENVLLELGRLFPEAPIFTLVHRPGSVHPELEAHPIGTSFVQRLPGAPARFRQYLPLFPRAIEGFELAGFDLVLSTSHCVAKGVRTRPDQLHVSYVHTPMRYIWDQLPSYLGALPAGRALAWVARAAVMPLRHWDVASAARPSLLVANSHFVRRRIARVWGRDAEVVYPPVDVDFFAAAPAAERRGFLVVSALVPYKRIELAVELATARRLPLTVVGEGGERARLTRAAGPTVRFVGALGRDELRRAYAEAEALWFCGEEDFGIVPVEAMAAGCPVIAYASGGALETVVDDGPEPTGVLYPWPTRASLEAGLDQLLVRRERGSFRPEVLRAQARRFDRGRFVEAMGAILGRFGVTLPAAQGCTQALTSVSEER
jgi:glycosyltransferase involved in cell wall biosynthesis